MTKLSARCSNVTGTKDEASRNFSEAVASKVGNYIYRLIDPRNGETFYVGKGKGNRVFQHVERTAIKGGDEISNLKYDRIRQIQNAHLAVIHVIHRHDIPDEAIFEVEAAVIDAYPGLTNIQGGYSSDAKGPMDYRQIIDKYELPELETNPSERLLLINVNNLEDYHDRKAIYDQVRYAWPIKLERARQAEYVLAVRRGVVIGAFVAEQWLPAIRENFSDIINVVDEREGRIGFVGREADDATWTRFVGERGKRVSNDDMKHVRFPIRYWNI